MYLSTPSPKNPPHWRLSASTSISLPVCIVYCIFICNSGISPKSGSAALLHVPVTTAVYSSQIIRARKKYISSCAWKRLHIKRDVLIDFEMSDNQWIANIKQRIRDKNSKCLIAYVYADAMYNSSHRTIKSVLGSGSRSVVLRVAFASALLFHPNALLEHVDSLKLEVLKNLFSYVRGGFVTRATKRNSIEMHIFDVSSVTSSVVSSPANSTRLDSSSPPTLPSSPPTIPAPLADTSSESIDDGTSIAIEISKGIVEHTCQLLRTIPQDLVKSYWTEKDRRDLVERSIRNTTSLIYVNTRKVRSQSNDRHLRTRRRHFRLWYYVPRWHLEYVTLSLVSKVKSDLSNSASKPSLDMVNEWQG